mgnify:CR=1 FL=1
MLGVRNALTGLAAEASVMRILGNIREIRSGKIRTDSYINRYLMQTI